MVKQRDPVAATVDKLAQRANVTSKGSSLRAIYDPKAKHTFTSVTIRLNQFEEELFKAAAEDSDRTAIDWMRRTLVKAAEDQLSNK
jgi:hypothetical protein